MQNAIRCCFIGVDRRSSRETGASKSSASAIGWPTSAAILHLIVPLLRVQSGEGGGCYKRSVANNRAILKNLIKHAK